MNNLSREVLLSELGDLNMLLSCDIQLSSRTPGLGSTNSPKPIKFIKFGSKISTEYISDDNIEDFKQANSWSFALVKKWCKPELERFLKESLIRPRAILNWKLLIETVIVRYNIRNSIKARLNEAISNQARKISNLSTRLTELYNELFNARKKIEKSSSKKFVRNSVFSHSLKKIEQLFREPSFEEIVNLKEKAIQSRLERIKSDIEKLVEKHDKEISKFKNASIESKKVEEIIRVNDWPFDQRCLSTKKDNETNNEKWFGFYKNKNLKVMQDICNVPKWLREINDESEVKIPDQQEVLTYMVKLSLIANSKHALYCVKYFVDGGHSKGLKMKKGHKEFGRTFDKVYNFSGNYKNLADEYMLICGYLAKTLNICGVFKNLYFLNETYSRSSEDSDSED